SVHPGSRALEVAGYSTLARATADRLQIGIRQFNDGFLLGSTPPGWVGRSSESGRLLSRRRRLRPNDFLCQVYLLLEELFQLFLQTIDLGCLESDGALYSTKVQRIRKSSLNAHSHRRCL